MSQTDGAPGAPRGLIDPADPSATYDSSRRTVEIARWFRQELFLGALLPTLLGGSGVVAAVFRLTDPDTIGIRVAVGILGVIFLAGGGGLYFWLLARTPRRWLDVDARGLTERYRRAGTTFMAWSEVESLFLVRTRFRLERGAGQRGTTVIRPKFPRYFLRVKVSEPAAQRSDIRDELLGPNMRDRILWIDLGVPSYTVGRVRDALGPRLDPPTIQRIADIPD